MKIQELEDLANEFLVDGCNIRDLDIEMAKVYFCIAWGYNRQLERADFMGRCEKLLKSTGLDEEKTKVYMDIGYKASVLVISLENELLRIVAEQH